MLRRRTRAGRAPTRPCLVAAILQPKGRSRRALTGHEPGQRLPLRSANTRRDEGVGRHSVRSSRIVPATKVGECPGSWKPRMKHGQGFAVQRWQADGKIWDCSLNSDSRSGEKSLIHWVSLSFSALGKGPPSLPSQRLENSVRTDVKSVQVVVAANVQPAATYDGVGQIGVRRHTG